MASANWSFSPQLSSFSMLSNDDDFRHRTKRARVCCVRFDSNFKRRLSARAMRQLAQNISRLLRHHQARINKLSRTSARARASANVFVLMLERRGSHAVELPPTARARARSILLPSRNCRRRRHRRARAQNVSENWPRALMRRRRRRLPPVYSTLFNIYLRRSPPD